MQASDRSNFQQPFLLIFLDAISISIVGHVGHSQGTIFEIYDEMNEILDLMRPKET